MDKIQVVAQVQKRQDIGNTQNTTTTETKVEPQSFYFLAKNGETEYSWKIEVKVQKTGNSEMTLTAVLSCLGSSDQNVHCSDPVPATVREQIHPGDEEGQSNTSGTVCAHCRKYLKSLFNALWEVDDSNTNTYVPYLYRVKDHWFRDVYFTGYAIEEAKEEDGSVTIVKNDDEYEEKTGERWTLYETYEDGEYEGEYKLYAYFKNGDNYNNELTDVLCEKVKKGDGKYKLSDDGITYVKAENGEGEYNLNPNRNETEFRVGKKAIEDTDITSDYLAYELGGVDTTWKKLSVNEESPENIQKVQKTGMDFYYQTTTGTIKQVEDGVRGATNPAIKDFFLDDYYLYDGTKSTAALIQAAKEATGTDNPDDFTGSSIEATVIEQENGNQIEKKYTSTIDQISGPISLSHSSLNAFSMLENMHTLDSEYIYRDFKELIVELNYFDKEDLVEPEDEVMMFPVDGVSAAGWPIVRYDKGEEFYGTLIHSAQDLEAKKAQTIAELMELLGEEEMPDEEEENTTTPAPNTNQPQESNNPLVLAAADVAAILTSTDASDYCQGTGLHENNSRGHSSHKRALTLSDLQTYLMTDCSGFVSICLQQVGVLSEGEGLSSGAFKDNLENKGAEVISNPTNDQLEPGMVCVYSSHVNIYAGNNMFYDWGAPSSNLPKTHGGTILYAIKIDPTTMTYNGVSGTNSTKSTAEFTGFEGGETVVAPITGEVLEYGTTSRTNLETNETDEVGFIKIRALGTDECQPGSRQGCDYFSGVLQKDIRDAITGNDVTQNKAEAWLEDHYNGQLDTLGYDYFWEEYNDAGIEDHIIYLEGFEVPDIGVTGNRESNIEKLANYISTLGEDGSDGEIKNSYASQYVIPNLLDDKREFQLKIGEEAKKRATYTLTKNGKIYIKEGAAVGKTFSPDADFVKEVEIEGVEGGSGSGSSNGPYKVGNYLRMIFYDTEGQKVENIEDYIEIPENGNESGLYAGFDAEVTEEEAEMLAAVILAENGDHMDAVCQVVKNRGNDKVHFGGETTIADVLTKSGQYGTVFPVGSNNNPAHKGGYGSAPNGSYTKVYELEGYGQFVVGNQGRNGGSFTERLATDESRAIVEGVLSGSIEDVASAKLGCLALFQKTLRDCNPHCEICAYTAGEAFSHLEAALSGTHAVDGCTLSN